jgi:uncharacterized protein (TIGR02646 family)
MIKITRPAAPPELDAQRVAELTQIFIDDDTKSPWKAQFIRSALLQMSSGKCAYCEARIDEESKYMEVDHYFCKSRHPTRVVEWTNLIPCCKRCNVNKGAHDVDTQGDLIDPTIDTPANHLILRNYRLSGRDEKGDRTIDILYLNETKRVVKARFDIGNVVLESLEKLMVTANECILDATKNRTISQLQRGFTTLLMETLPSTQYSATAATSIAHHPNYLSTKNALVALNCWTDELIKLEANMLAASLGAP